MPSSASYPNKDRYSEHFSTKEMHDGGFAPPSAWMRIKMRTVCSLLERVRSDLGGRPIIVTSGYRTPAINEACGGAPQSYHMQAMAADIQVAGVTPASLGKVCQRYFTGVITYPAHVHVDIRETPYVATGAYK